MQKTRGKQFSPQALLVASDLHLEEGDRKVIMEASQWLSSVNRKHTAETDDGDMGVSYELIYKMDLINGFKLVHLAVDSLQQLPNFKQSTG